jgi:uncharacterized protein YbjQ (UPF0145 family)
MKKCANCWISYSESSTTCTNCGSSETIKSAEQMNAEQRSAELRLQQEASEKEQKRQEYAEWLLAKDARDKQIEIWRGEYEVAERKRALQLSVDELKSVTSEFLAKIEVLTLPSHPTRAVSKVLGLVKGVGKIQGGVFSLRNQQTIYDGSFESAQQELILDAASMGANAILGVMSMVNSNSPTASVITGGTPKSEETVILYGTAVVLD